MRALPWFRATFETPTLGGRLSAAAAAGVLGRSVRCGGSFCLRGETSFHRGSRLWEAGRGRCGESVSCAGCGWARRRLVSCPHIIVIPVDAEGIQMWADATWRHAQLLDTTSVKCHPDALLSCNRGVTAAEAAIRHVEECFCSW